MRHFALLVLLLGAVWTQTSAVCTGRVGNEVYVGDLTPTDYVFQSDNGAGQVSLPQMQIGGAYLNFDVDVYGDANLGCLFSFQAPSQSQAAALYTDAWIVNGELHFSSNGVEAQTFAVWPANQWNRVTISYDQAAKRVVFYLNGGEIARRENFAMIPQAMRKGTIGYCPLRSAAVKGLNGRLDNFRISTEPKDTFSIAFEQTQFFPIVPANGLVAYYDFNNWVAADSVPAFVGTAANPGNLDGKILGTASRPLRGTTAVTDRTCAFSGGVTVNAAGEAIAPFWGEVGGGYTQTFQCSDGATQHFTFAQKWHEKKGLTELAIFASVDHRFRLSVVPSGLQVLHQNWGGWERIGTTTEYVEDDLLTLQISEKDFKLQVGGYGWIHVYENNGLLAYEYALISTKCNGGVAVPANNDMCGWSRSDYTVYSFAATPLPEPMGPDADTAGGLGGLPDVLACPRPGDPCPGWYCDGTGVYRPDVYCARASSAGDARCCSYSAAFRQANKVCMDQYPEDYCSAHPEDDACCPLFPSRAVCLNSYPELYCKTSAGRSNDACCTKGAEFECQDMCWNNYPSLFCNCASNKQRADRERCCRYTPNDAWCVALQPPSPPPPPPSPIVEPPFTPSNPCANMQTTDPTRYAAVQATCKGIWGAADSNQLRQCIAVSCTIGDEQPPKPDCNTAEMLYRANPSYVRPEQCVSGCPNGCSYHGTCDSVSQTCTCSADWSGADCSVPKKYSCWQVTNKALQMSVQPVQEIYRHPAETTRNFQVTQYYNSFAVQDRNSVYAIRVADAVTVTPVSTFTDLTTRNKDYHLWITAGDARTNTMGEGYAEVTISAASQLLVTRASSDANVVGVAPSGSLAQCKTSGAFAASLYAGTATSITCKLSWQQGGQATIGIIGLTANQAFTVTTTTTKPVLVAGNARQSDRIVETLRMVPDTDGGNVFTMNFVNKNCVNSGCVYDTCDACAADAACGWCVELNTCMPGAPVGPDVGTCLNWRYSFDSTITRRLTQIPGFPSNPATTDVITSTSDSAELPIDLSVVIQHHTQVPWDLVMLTQFQDSNANAWANAIEDLRTKFVSTFPNLAMSFGALADPAWSSTGYRMLFPGTNPNANNNFKWVAAKCSASCRFQVPPTSLYIKKALYSFGDPNNNDFMLRMGYATRRLVTILSTASVSSADTTSVADIRARLLAKNAVPVFIVSANVAASYQALVDQLGFGAVLLLDASWSASSMQTSVIAAISRASYQVSLTHMISTETVLDTAAFTARKVSYTINGLQPDTRNGYDLRARMILPVRNTNTATPGDAQLYVPGFSSATVEHVPTDKPTFKGAVATYNVNEGDAAGVVIHLPGESFRNLYRVVPQVTIASKAGGKWHKLADEIRNGAPYYGAGDEIADPSGMIMPEGGLVFVPPTGFAQSQQGVTFGDNFASITYTLWDSCAKAATEFTININVIDVNYPPFANAIPAHGPEYTPIIIQLDGSDIDGDAFDYYIAGTPVVRDSSEAQNTNAGKLYQYADNFDPTNLDAFVEITAPDTKVTGGARVIYMPPRFKHSFADPEAQPERLLIPCVSFYVKESSTAQLRRSETVDVPVTIDHVNNAPWVWNDPDRAADATLPSFERTWGFDERFPSPSFPQGTTCWAGYNAPVCEWQEDFGEEYWWMTGFRYINMGGYDIDGGRLDIEITSMDCFPGATVMVNLAGSESITVGAKINDQENGVLIPTLRFRPVKETHTGNFAGRNYYCKIGYRVRDDQDAISLNEGSVTIDITNVNKQPRIETYETTFTAYEQVPYSFSLEVDDPELDAFTTTLLGCAVPRGTYQFCLDEFCNNVQTIDCATFQGPQVIQPTANSKYSQAIFTSDRLKNPSEGIGYNVLSFKFEDGVSQFPARPFDVTFNVIRLNTPPVITVDGEAADQHLRATQFDNTFSAQFDVDDKDIEQGYVTMTVKLDNSRAPTAVLDTTYAAQFVTIVKKEDGSSFTFEAELAEAKKAIAVLSVSSPTFEAERYPDGVATAVLRVTANDNGNSGQCPTDTFLRLSNCPLETTTAVVITWSKAADNTAAVIGGSAAAAGFGVVAIAAAAAIFRRMQASAANDKYEPWLEDNVAEEHISNPLYEGTGNSGTNALYDASEAFNPVANNGL